MKQTNCSPESGKTLLVQHCSAMPILCLQRLSGSALPNCKLPWWRRICEGGSTLIEPIWVYCAAAFLPSFLEFEHVMRGREEAAISDSFSMRLETELSRRSAQSFFVRHHFLFVFVHSMFYRSTYQLVELLEIFKLHGNLIFTLRQCTIEIPQLRSFLLVQSILDQIT